MASNRLKIRVIPKFLAAIFNGTGTSVRKDGLASYVDLDYSQFVETGSYDPANDLIAIWNKSTDAWHLISPTVPVVGSYQAVGGASAPVSAGTKLLAITRVAPTATALALPTVASQLGVALTIVDWSTSIVGEHAITLTPNGAETIMQRASWQMISVGGVSLATITLIPSTDLNGWVIGS